MSNFTGNAEFFSHVEMIDSLNMQIIEKENEIVVKHKYYSKEGSKHTKPMRFFHNMIKNKLIDGSKPLLLENSSLND